MAQQGRRADKRLYGRACVQKTHAWTLVRRVAVGLGFKHQIRLYRFTIKRYKLLNL